MILSQYEMMKNMDERCNSGLENHLKFYQSIYSDDFFVLACQGSMNYHLWDEESDVDTKILAIPNLKSICLNQNPINKTLILENEEHCDAKDIRLYFQTFRKQNINFVEILFTDYCLINDMYESEWNTLLMNREDLVHMNEYRAMSCIVGMAREKRHALDHRYQGKVDIIDKFGYDPKQLHHLWRLSMFAEMYAKDYPYSSCLTVPYEDAKDLIQCKRNGLGLSHDKAEEWADELLQKTEKIAESYRSTRKNEDDKKMSNLLDEVLYSVMKKSIKNELTIEKYYKKYNEYIITNLSL